MIVGAHSIIHSSDADSDRAFLRDVIGLPHVDVGGGWLIFGLPPAELAFHPGDNGQSEFYLMTDDIEQFVAQMEQHGAACSALDDQGWGILTSVTLPSGSPLRVYEPRHERPEPPAPKGRGTRKASTAKRGKAKKKAPRASKSAKKAAPKKKKKR